MTKIKIFPLFSNSVNLYNMEKFTKSKGWDTVQLTESLMDKVQGIPTSSQYWLLEISKTLTTGEKTQLTNLFQGTAYIEFA